MAQISDFANLSQDSAEFSPTNLAQADVHSLLELLNTTNDLDLQLKLFSTLSAHLISNKGSNLIIIQSRAVYYKLKDVLTRALPYKAPKALNFLCALLHVDADRSQAANKRTALYAKHMTRISGCLDAMVHMFSNYCMMTHETWSALCQCLVDACCDCVLNQSYCTPLVPACIEKCNQKNIDMLLVLQSLLQNHERNVQLFLDYNGISVFTRDLLHYDKCLQLLITVLQCSAEAVAMLHKSQVMEHLKYFLRTYGPQSQIGQKATIIVNFVEVRAKVNAAGIKTINIKEVQQSETAENHPQYDNSMELDDTKTLVQNIIKEVYRSKSENRSDRRKSKNKYVPPLFFVASRAKSSNTTLNTYSTKIPNQRQFKHTKRDSCNFDSDLSFSCLQEFEEIAKRKRTSTDNKTNNTRTMRLQDTRAHYRHILETQQIFKNDTVLQFSTESSIEDFKPRNFSTPVKLRKATSKSSQIIRAESSKYTTQRQVTVIQNERCRKRISKKNQQNSNKKLRNTSLSTRLFSAINESCTTIVKTFKNLFKKNHSSEGSSEDLAMESETRENGTFSFMNYMKVRDAALNKKHSKTSESEDTRVPSCTTCNNTRMMKRKLLEDDSLKETVKKLKLGINLYGCNFKKISRTMWPRESYMTPTVVNNLYRKLIKNRTVVVH